ncbi:receptor kinase [Musa troglodytarum]|uniref:non-specific serine/threonine protein kinase n=1 Tax=Musa troglodytarum TaxID=320322 RepID=A0A9E7HPI6_9LILI|nr:receptor kinase [Musa troglodytarum]
MFLKALVCLLLLLLLLHRRSSLAAPSSGRDDGEDFIFNGFAGANLTLDGVASITSTGLLMVTDTSMETKGHAFHPSPLRFRGLSNGIVVFILRRRTKYSELLEDWELEYGPHRFSYKDLFHAAKGFRDTELLGMGGFGRVYKGVLPSSRSEVAIKRVSHGSRQGMREFIAEIVSLGRLRHRNLVQLLGYCRRQGELLLVYDYMSNGSLEKFLHDQAKPTLDWAMRFRIIKGVASGLLYLHEDWEQVVIHRDIKASNVLLDDELNGRLGDFGLARLYDHGTDPQTTHVVGTMGYLAPELARTGKATTITDVFAFGAFLLEVACGRRPVDPTAHEEQLVLLDWVVEKWRKGSILETRDPRLGEEYAVEEVELVLKLGLLCSHPLPTARPSMRQVVRYLEGHAPLPELTPASLSFSLLALLRKEGFDDHIMSCPSSSVATASVLSGDTKACNSLLLCASKTRICSRFLKTDMSPVLLRASVCLLLLLFLHRRLAASANGGDSFTYSGFRGANLTLDGVAAISSGGLLVVTNKTTQIKGHAFHPSPLHFRNPSNGTIFSFSTTFVFGFVSEFTNLSGNGMAFLVSPTMDFSKALGSQYLGLFNQSNNGNSTNHVLAIELDSIFNPEFADMNDNHVGIDINGLKSNKSQSAGYYADDSGLLNSLSLRNCEAMQVWVDYDGQTKLINVTLAPVRMAKPHKPLLSDTIDLSSVLLDPMYVGFSASTGPFLTSHYVLGWSFKMNGVAPDLDDSLLPLLPCPSSTGKSNVLDIVLPLASAGLVLITVGIIVLLEMELVLKLGLLCSHPLPAGRPSMRQVVEYLEGNAPLPELSPTYLSFGVLAMLHNEGFDDYIIGRAMQVWVDYDSRKMLLNVTLAPVPVVKPRKPLLSAPVDLSSVFSDTMYVGFSSSTGPFLTSHYVLGWSFKMNGVARALDYSLLPSLPRTKSDRRSKALRIGLPLASAALVAIVAGIIVLYVRWRIRYAELLEDWEVEYGPHRFSYRDLFNATKGFQDKELLGIGGFGRVYRGVLPSSRSEIAVKRVSHGSRQGMREFIAEIVSIGRLRHRNLVQLLGYCRRKGELLLVYDYMPNGSLDKFLYDQDKPTLDWATRFRIIKGVASGLLYLHEDWEQVVVHRDIKASNVLLDHEWNGRLGDFGLARLYDHGTDPLTTHVVGTTGYLAPELVRNGKATTVTDVFAFGAFVLEVACGRRPVDTMADEEQFVLLDWVVENWGRGSILETRDARLGEECVAEEVELVLKLGLLCSHPLPAARPSMRQVVRYLEGDAPLPELSPTYLSFSVLGLLQNKGFDDHIVSYPSSSVATASVISGISGEAAIVSTDSKHNPRLLVDGESIAEETTDTPKPRFLLASDRLLFSLMASNGSAGRTGGVESSLEKIKRQLMSGSGKYLLQGPLLKRSETLRKWNERWVILDPTTGKMEYNATQLVLHAHKEAVTNLSGSGSVKLGTIATVVATANSTAMEASKEIEAAMRISMKAALGLLTNKANEGQLDDFTIMKETIRVKDEELQQLAKDIRARDSTIKDITDKLIETAEAAEAAASAAHAIDEERRISCLEIEHLTNDAQKQLETAQLKLRESEEKVMALATERELLLKQRNSALQEAHLWRSELAKAREHAVILEAAVFRAEGRARALEVDAGTRVNDAVEKALAAAREKEDLLALVNVLQTQVQRQQSNTDGTTKHVDLSEDDVDKACLSDPRVLLDSADIEVQLGVDGVEIRSIGDAEWGNFQSAAARTADVREISLQSATPLVASLSVAAAAMGGRYLIQAWQAFKARPVVPRVRRFYPGGFEQQMTIREAALILGVREHAPLDKIKEAHRRVMVANHPDSGGSHYLASKINEAKDVSDIEEVKQKEM